METNNLISSYKIHKYFFSKFYPEAVPKIDRMIKDCIKIDIFSTNRDQISNNIKNGKISF